MKKYIKVDWPESHEWIFGEFDDEVEFGNEEGVVFVPEKLYNRVKNEHMETFSDRGEEFPVDVCPYCGVGLEYYDKGRVVCPECHEVFNIKEL